MYRRLALKTLQDITEKKQYPTWNRWFCGKMATMLVLCTKGLHSGHNQLHRHYHLSNEAFKMNGIEYDTNSYFISWARGIKYHRTVYRMEKINRIEQFIFMIQNSIEQKRIEQNGIEALRFCIDLINSRKLLI